MFLKSFKPKLIIFHQKETKKSNAIEVSHPNKTLILMECLKDCKVKIIVNINHLLVQIKLLQQKLEIIVCLDVIKVISIQIEVATILLDKGMDFLDK
jgi:hypothetical protein